MYLLLQNCTPESGETGTFPVMHILPQFLKNRQKPIGVILQLKDHIRGLHLDYRIKGMFSQSGLKLFLE